MVGVSSSTDPQNRIVLARLTHVLHGFQGWDMNAYSPMGVCPGDKVGEILAKRADIAVAFISDALKHAAVSYLTGCSFVRSSVEYPFFFSQNLLLGH